MLSCLFCYFAGLYLLAAKLGIMRLISQYGLSRAFAEWPADFPSLKLVWIFLSIYTLCFILIGYYLYKVNENHAKETDALQQKASVVHNYAEKLSLMVSLYKQTCKTKGIGMNLLQRIQLLQKQVATLTPAALESSNSSLSAMANSLEDAISEMGIANTDNVATIEQKINDLIEQSLIEIQRIRTNSIKIK